MNKRLVVFLGGLLVVIGVYGRDLSDSLEIDTLSSGVDSLTDTEIDQRLQSLQEMLEQNEKQATTWWWSWIGIYGAATIVQGAVAAVSDEKATRQDMILGAGTTLAGAVGQLIAPVKTTFNAEKDLNLSLHRLEKFRKMQEMETLLQKQAAIAVNGKGFQMQALAGCVNLTSGLITWLGFKRSVWDGLANFALNTAVTEVQIFTQPVKAKKDYRRYAAQYGLEGSRPPARNPVEWYAQALPGGLQVGLAF
jgi:hypothetical protein